MELNRKPSFVFWKVIVFKSCTRLQKKNIVVNVKEPYSISVVTDKTVKSKGRHKAVNKDWIPLHLTGSRFPKQIKPVLGKSYLNSMIKIQRPMTSTPD